MWAQVAGATAAYCDSEELHADVDVESDDDSGDDIGATTPVVSADVGFAARLNADAAEGKVVEMAGDVAIMGPAAVDRSQSLTSKRLWGGAEKSASTDTAACYARLSPFLQTQLCSEIAVYLRLVVDPNDRSQDAVALEHNFTN